MGHVKVTAQLSSPVAAEFLERLAKEVREEGLSLQIWREDADGIIRNSPFVTLAAEKPVQDWFFVGVVEVLLEELRVRGEQ